MGAYEILNHIYGGDLVKPTTTEYNGQVSKDVMLSLEFDSVIILVEYLMNREYIIGCKIRYEYFLTTCVIIQGRS